METISVMDGKEVTLNKQLRIKRILEGKTQAELGQQLSIAQPTISKYELNLKKIKSDHYQVINNYLEN